MVEVATKYPAYGFEKHVGYGTQMHRHALYEHGICPEHRRSFGPIQKLTNAYAFEKPTKKNTTKIGGKAEDVVAKYLEERGHRVVGRNWKTRRCEIDIVSVRGEKIYFTEVKYRRLAGHGTGLEVVGKEKLRQMKFASESYLRAYDVGLEPLLAVASVSGVDFRVEDFLVLNN